MILGVGVGTLKEEFDLIGAPFDQRGPRSDDALRALRASLSRSEPAYHGEFYDFEGFVVDPCAVQEHVPIWVGGRTLRSLRRAAALGRRLVPVRRAARPRPPNGSAPWRSRPASTWSSRRPRGSNPINEPARTQEILAETAAYGATIIVCGFKNRSLSEYLEKLEALAAVQTAMSTP